MPKESLDLEKEFMMKDKMKFEFDQEMAPESDKSNDFSFDSSSSLAKALVGSVGKLSDYYFPADLIGGCCPRIAGSEQDIVWNAAAEAADTERVHIVWQAMGEKIWYLAVHSVEQSSHPSTWCPFASLLPGMTDAAMPPIVYTYFSDEMATMMTVMEDGLHIHRGTSSVVRAKAERISRELGDVPIIDLVPDRIAKLTPVPWYSLSLFEDRARRVLAVLAVLGALAVVGVSLLIWLGVAMSIVSSHADLDVIKQRSQAASLQLLQTVQAQRASPMREQVAVFSDINDGLLSLNGFLEIYTIVDKKAVWRAIIPSNVTSDGIKSLGGRTLDIDEKGVVIGNSQDSLTIEKSAKGRRRR